MSHPSLSTATAAILAGGFGTRLRAAVADRPKVMALVLGRPFITYLLDQVAGAGVRHAVLCTGYMGEQLRRDLGESYGPVRLEYSLETTPLGTGGALALAAPLLASDPVLVTNGDSYCDADLPALWAFHRAKGAAATLQLTAVPDTSRYGRVRVGDDGAALGFEEKGGAGGPGQINAGIYCLARGLLQNLPADQSVSLEREVFPRLVGHGLFARAGTDQFLDIGTPESYAQAAAFFAGRINPPPP